MKNAFNIFIFLILTLPSKEVKAQVSSYRLGETYPIFFELERLLEEGKEDSVLLKVDSILQNNNNPIITGCAHFYGGQAEEVFRQFDIAHLSYNKAIILFESEDYNIGLALANIKKGDLYNYQGKVVDALINYNSASSYAKMLKLNDILIDVYQKQARVYFDSQNKDSSFYFLEKALKYSMLEHDNDQTINIINQISTNYHTQGELDSAIFYFKESLRIKQNIDDPEGLISDFSALGNLYKERGDYEMAQQNLMEALNMAEMEFDSFAMTTIYSELGDIYAAQSIWNVSEDYYSKAVLLAKLKNSRFMEAGGRKKLGYIFQQQEEDKKAIDSYEVALKLYSQLKNRVSAAEVMINLSQVYKNEDQFDKIKSLLQEALKTSNQTQDVISTLNTKMALAEIEIKLKNFNKGIAYAEECRNAYTKMEDREGLKQVSLLLSEAYSKKGDYKNAYYFHHEYSILKDSLVNVDRAEVIKKYALLVTTKKKDEEISSQNKQLQKQQLSLLKKNNQLLMMGGGLGIIALLTSFLLFVYFKNKQINRQRIQVFEKEKETQRLKAIIEGEEKERKRFARELHDGLGAVLATVKMQISSVRHKFPNVDSSPTFQKAETLIDNACRTIREISHDLMPHVLEQQGLIPAIDDICQNLSLQEGIEFDFIHYGDESGIGDIIKITLYRITQELLKNITKHAEASEVIVQLTIEDDEIILIVEDDGKGFDPTLKQNGIGIKNIQSRTDYLDGKLDLESSIGQGSTFTIQLPLKKQLNLKR